MKNYGMLVLDFDGTLVDSRIQLNYKVKKKLVELVNAGILVTVATGRPYLGAIESICSALQLKTPQIVLGGAEIVSPSSGETLWQSLLDNKIVQKITTYLVQKNLSFKLESHDAIFFKGIAIPKREKSTLVLRNFSEFKNHGIAKVLVYPNASYSYEYLISHLRILFPDLNFNGHEESLNLLTAHITSGNANKKYALEKLGMMVNISPSQMVGVGNGLNDIDLLQGCGLRVAMADAPDELKSVADFVVPSAEVNGLMEIFDKIKFSSTV